MPIKQAAPRQHHFMQITSQQIEEIRAGKIKTFEILFNAHIILGLKALHSV